MISAHDTVYISGPMTNIPDFNKPAFFATEYYLRSKYGCQVINPGRQPERPTWEDYMRHDVRLLEKATVLLQLPGWASSRGAVIEYDLALMHGILIVGVGDIIEVGVAA